MFEATHAHEDEEPEPEFDSTTEEGALDPKSALVRLHAALRELDDALYSATRALEEAFGRPASAEPHRALPIKELTTLGEQLRRTRFRRAGQESRQSIMDIAGEPPIQLSEELEELDKLEEPADKDAGVGVAPSGPLRVD